jgi:hypothetical protein
MAALEVVALDTVTPQLRAPGTGDTYSAPRALALAPESVTGAATRPSLDITQTWDTSGLTSAIKLRVTDTASNVNSLLLDLGTTSAVFTVSKFGAVSAGNYVACSHIRMGATMGVNDVYIVRDAANILALRNGTSAQEFRWSYSWTDASNRQGGALKTASDQIIIEAQTAGTGADNLDVTLTPAGTGAVRFGTHSAVAAELVTGYITIKDAGGTSRKIAVIS